MSVKIVIPVALACLVALVLSDSQAVPSANQQPQHAQAGALAAARKIRLLGLNPGAIKLYRLLGGGALRQDDDDLFADDESYFQKRQYDDYGHMRFGKRNPKDFDDYGHMRFGKK